MGSFLLGAYPLLADDPPVTPTPQPAPIQPSVLALGEGPWVMRAYYDNRQMLNALAARNEPWEVNRDEGYVVVEVADLFEYLHLQESGFKLEVDTRLTAQLNQPNQRLPGQISGIPGYPCYRTVEETFATAEEMVNTNPNLATWIDIGDSWEKTEAGGNAGYDLQVLKLTNAGISGSKPKIFIMSSVHAREYTPAELNTRLAKYLVNNYGVDPDVTWLLDYNARYYDSYLCLHNPIQRLPKDQSQNHLAWLYFVLVLHLRMF